MAFRLPLSIRKYLFGLAVLLIGHFALGRLGMLVHFGCGTASPMWPPTGFALAGLLLGGYRYWPAVLVSGTLLTLSTGASLLNAGIVGIGGALEALAGAFMLRQLVGFRTSLARLQDVLGLVLFGAGLSTAISAAVGAASACLLSNQPWNQFRSIWWVWWLGDATGDLIVAPVVLTWGTNPSMKLSFRRSVEAASLVACLLLACRLIFGSHMTIAVLHYPLLYLVFPFLIWAALRFDQRGASLASLLIGFVGIANISRVAPAVGPDAVREGLLLLQTFMGVVAITVLVLGAVIAEREAAEHASYQSQVALRSSEERFRRLLENAADIVSVVGPDGKLRYESPAGAQVWGPVEQRSNRDAFAFLASDERKRLDQFFKELVQRPGAIVRTSFRFRRPDDGATRVIDALCHNLVEDPVIQGIVINSRDVTEQVQAEEAVRASEAKYRSLTENLEHSIFLKDAELRFQAVNRPFAESLNRSEHEIVGKTDLDFYPPALAEKYRADDRRVLLEGERLELEEENVSQGKTRFVRVIKTPVKNDQGQNIGVLGIFWDVTEQRTLEAQLRQAQKMEAIGQLAGGIAHDFNNLLTAILGNLSLVLADHELARSHQELLSAAEQASQRAANLTRQLLGFSRRAMLRPQTVQLNAILEEAAGLLRRTIDPRIQLIVHPAANLGTVQADPNQLNQVLMNLCINARDAMPEGGRLMLQTSNVTIDPDYARLHLDARPGDFVRLRVEDTGQGIPPDIRSRIFEPFFTTKEPGKGTGLGLATVFGIVKQHEGWLECYSEVGQGTRFDVYLPRSSKAEPATTLPASPPPRAGHETILLVDDEAIIRNLGKAILGRYGYQVLLAADGLDALEVYRRHRGQIDLVVLDLTMPRLSGRDAFHRLRELNPAVRILFASGYSAEHVASSDGDHLQDFVSKPYRPDELARAVREILDRPESALAMMQN